MESIVGAREKLRRLSTSEERQKFKSSRYRESVKMIADLVHLNFAYTPISLSSEILGIREKGKPTRRKLIFPTLQTTVLAFRTPIRAIDQSPIPRNIAETLVRFGLQLRCKIIEWILKRGSRTAGDIIPPVYAYMSRNLDDPAWVEARELRDVIKGTLQLYILREALLAPYYLHLYGYLELDPIMYLIMWELH